MSEFFVKLPQIGVTYAIYSKYTVMISFENTISALITMIGSMRFISFAPPTHVPAHGHVFIFLKCLFRTYF